MEQPGPETIQRTYNQVGELLEQGRWQEAEALLEPILHHYPHRPELRLLLGQCRQRQLWGEQLLQNGQDSNVRYQRWIRHQEAPLGDPLQPLVNDWWSLESGADGALLWRPLHGGACRPAHEWPLRGWFVQLDPACRLREGALPWLEAWIASHPGAAAADVLYGDEDELDPEGHRCLPWFKPSYSLESFCSSPWLEGLSVWRIAWLRDRSAPLPGLDALDRWRWQLEQLAAHPKLAAAPVVLSHRRPTESLSGGDRQARADALMDHLSAQGEPGVQVEPHPNCADGFRLRWPLAPGLRCRVVIPTRDRADLLERCLQTLWQQRGLGPEALQLEIVVVDNGSSEAATTALLQSWSQRLGSSFAVLPDPRPFNWSALNNAAAAGCQADLLLFLNNDIEVLETGWLERMAAQAMRPAIGAVGAVLLYPDGRVQHAGVATGLKGLADHVYRGLPHASAVHRGRLHLLTTWGAVTGACLMVRRTLFEQVGGFDEGLPVEFNDLEFCLRLAQLGYRHVVEPEAVLIHHESQSRDVAQSATEAAAVKRIKRLWGAALSGRDPAWPLQCDLDAADGRAERMRWMI